tara:strand:- start:85 stop:264 length:180 start_codon:yes stop_codon:yes gene_type:complete
MNLIPHPENKDIFYNINQVVKIEKESYSIYWLTFSNGESVRFYDIDVIQKIRKHSDIEL